MNNWQYQFCYALSNSSDHCTNLSGNPISASPDIFPGANEVQTASLQLLLDANFLNDYLEATDVGLNASSYLQSMWIYNQIPDNQWAIEIVEWERYIWAQLQTFVSDYSVGYGIQWPELTPLLRRNMTNGEKRLCQVQRRMKSGGLV